MSAKNECNKVSYGNRKLANRAANAIQARNGKILWPYKCRRCRQWHLTSGSQGRLQRAFRRVKEKRHDRLPV